MQRTTLGAIALGVVGLTMIGIGYVAMPHITESRVRQTSDAKTSKGQIFVGVDDFIGYFPLCSPYMGRLMLVDGYTLTCVDDKLGMQKRLSNLRDGKIQMAVSTVDTYLTLGPRFNFPGTVVAVLDESAGADGVVANKNIQSLDELRGKVDVKFAFAPETPSDHLRKIVATHFDIPILRSQDKNNRIEAKDSRDAYSKLSSGGAQIAILWEPELSRALSQGYNKLLGSEQIQGQIVDVLLASRDFQDKNPELLQRVLSNYFRTLKYYRDNQNEFNREAARYAQVEERVVGTMLQGVSWKGLAENAELWFGAKQGNETPKYGFIETVTMIAKIQAEFGENTFASLPGQDPRRIVNSSTLLSLYDKGGVGDAVKGNIQAKFSPLGEDGWSKLRTIGALKTRPIDFSVGVANLDNESRKQIDASAEAIKSYPNFRIEVHGHTGIRGDAAENLQLSQERAEAVTRYLEITHGIDGNRIRAIGYGSSRPLTQTTGESFRSYQSRLPRVEIYLKGEVY